MNIKRKARRLIPAVKMFDTARNIVKEKSVKQGIKRTVKEDICEDSIVGNLIYQSGRYDGKTEGYCEASAEYEKKLMDQADEFLRQKTIAENQFNAYKMLVSKLKNEIEQLERKLDRTEEENRYLRQLKDREEQLQKLRVES